MQPSRLAVVSKSQSENADRSKEIDALKYRLAAIETALNAVRDIARLQADMAHTLQEEQQSITLNAQAFRGTMTFFTAQLEEAIESLGEAKEMVPLLKE